mmetsp:Transcript_30247/g.33990  ORF Transcript_30247/g.33990 Transcript_30247/m.33990 type:complete len:716 (-) Transcript_30247:256-2403(-)
MAYSGAGGSSSSWTKVVAGARLVASAVLQQSAKKTSVAAQRIVYHGADLSSKGRQTVSALTSSSLSPASQEIIWSTLRNAFPATIIGDNKDTYDEETNVTSRSSSHSEVNSGTGPYESQLRRKRQRQNQEKKSSENLTLEEIKEDIPNPYLFHYQPTTSSTNEKYDNTIISNKTALRQPTVSLSLSSGSSISNDNQRKGEGKINSNNALEQEDQQDDRKSTTHEVQTQSNTTTTIAVDNNETKMINISVEERLQEGRAVPSSKIGRALGFASLGAGLAWGAVGEIGSRIVGGGSGSSNVLTTDANADRLAATLCRMRGAALKMGQMLSIQDESLLPPALTRALKKVRQGADAMPKYQLVEQLRSQLGDGSNNDNVWREKFVSFDDNPFAAASIGQVHRATVIDVDTGKIKPVVVKVQYPGIAHSIESDLGNLGMLVKMSGLAPKGLFIENVIRVGRDELKIECNYVNEMANQETFQRLVNSDPVLQLNKFVVPDVFEDLTTEQVITTGFASGGTIDKVSHLNQEERNRIGRTILYLTMQELFVWRLMQTDPNWGNFLYDVGTGTTTLIDFGATREFPKSFVDGYLRIVWASANRDENTLMTQSREMNFLTGEENEIMLNAHKLSGFTVGEPFGKDEPFDFQGSRISSRLSEHTSVFLRHRLTPPPVEVYTLHRKLAGAYMLCIKLKSVINSRDILESVVANHVFEDRMPNPITGK